MKLFMNLSKKKLSPFITVGTVLIFSIYSYKLRFLGGIRTQLQSTIDETLKIQHHNAKKVNIPMLRMGMNLMPIDR